MSNSDSVFGRPYYKHVKRGSCCLTVLKPVRYFFLDGGSDKPYEEEIILLLKRSDMAELMAVSLTDADKYYVQSPDDSNVYTLCDTIYTVLARASLRDAKGEGLDNQSFLVFYQDILNGSVYARERSEFRDGRFVEVETIAIDSWVEHNDKAPDGEQLVALINEFTISSHREAADQLDRIREKIGRDDVDSWNALLYSASDLRVQVYRLEMKKVPS